MSRDGNRLLICNCEKTMEIDGEKLGKALGQDNPVTVHTHLCRAGMAAFEGALDGTPILLGCTQEAPLFLEIAEENEADVSKIRPFNIREKAGWTQHDDKRNVTAKMAALVAEAGVDVRPAGLSSVTSEGICLVYGHGQAALDVAKKLNGRLSVSVLLADAGDVLPPDVADVPLYRGKIREARGSLGNFELIVDAYAPISPSSRQEAEFIMPRDGASSACDIIIDMTGGMPLFTGHQRRDGYFHVDPNHPLGIADMLFEASDLVGTFEKPIYVAYDADICAHSRSQITGCSKCLDVCPAGAITENGDHVSIDNGICGGCGSCSAVCPTSAVSYTYPTAEDYAKRLKALLSTYLNAGGERPVILVHDEKHGSPLISALARFGQGLPGNVIPFSAFSVTSIGHDVMASAFAYGAEHIVILHGPEARDEIVSVEAEKGIADAVLHGFGYGAERIHIVEETDPDALGQLLSNIEPAMPLTPSDHLPLGNKRALARSAFTALQAHAPMAADVIALPEKSPYGAINIDTGGCTLCLACVSACPADALIDDPDRPSVRFVESSCVQCGLCAATCPESVITLQPQMNLSPAAMAPTTLNEDEPFECVSCGKPFGSKAAIERISEKLAGKHHMFGNEDRSRLIQMCDNCRIEWQANQEDNPFAYGERPKIRTTEDYLAARNGAPSMDDFLADD